MSYLMHLKYIAYSIYRQVCCFYDSYIDVVNKDEDDIKQIFEDTNRTIMNGLFAGINELFEEIKFYNINIEYL